MEDNKTIYIIPKTGGKVNMEQLENRMVMPEPKYRTWQEIEDYNNYLLEEQDRKWEDYDGR